MNSHPSRYYIQTLRRAWARTAAIAHRAIEAMLSQPGAPNDSWTNHFHIKWTMSERMSDNMKQLIIGGRLLPDSLEL